MRLRELVEILEERYDPSWAEPWDRVGLVCGDPDDEVSRVLFAVDPVAAVVDEAVETGVDALVVHHPLLLTPVSSVAATTPKGRVLHRLVRAGVALYTAHTSADVPAYGVNDAIAQALDLVDPLVLAPTDGGLDKLSVVVPPDAAEAVRSAVTAAGAGRIGDYDGCTFSLTGEGRFRPLEGADPAVGQVGREEVTREVRLEALVPRRLRGAVVAAMRAVHPYEEPAFDVVEIALVPGQTRPGSTRGHGRVGALPEPMSLAAFAAYVDRRFPRTAHGIRVAGDGDRVVQRVAVAAGSGESLLEDARAAGADVFLTSDLKHHRTSEFLESCALEGGPAVVDLAHWAAEWSWLPVVQAEVDRATAARGRKVETRVSTIVTDPWTFRV